ncbi:MAG: hypothetical protein ABIU58_13130 [Ramlibacter sp.]
MHYRCPQCKEMLSVPKLFFSDISACKHCAQKVQLGDFVAFFMAAIAMVVTALTTLYKLTVGLTDPIVAGGYAVSVGMFTGIVVLILLGKAVPFRKIATHRPSQAAKL